MFTCVCGLIFGILAASLDHYVKPPSYTPSVVFYYTRLDTLLSVYYSIFYTLSKVFLTAGL